MKSAIFAITILHVLMKNRFESNNLDSLISVYFILFYFFLLEKEIKANFC